MLGRKQHVRLQFVESRALGVGGHQHVVDERDVDAPRAQLVRELVLCGLANRELDLGMQGREVLQQGRQNRRCERGVAADHDGPRELASAADRALQLFCLGQHAPGVREKLLPGRREREPVRSPPHAEALAHRGLEFGDRVRHR